MGHRMLSITFSPTDLCCHGNKIWDKVGYNSTCVKNFWEIFAPIKGSSGMGYPMLPIAFFPDRPLLPWQPKLDKTGFNSACVRDFCTYREVFGDAPSNAANCFFPGRPPLPWQRNFGQKSYNSVCVRDICEICASEGGFSGMGHWMLPVAFSPIDPRYYRNHKIGWGLGRGQRPFPRKIKMWWIVSLEHKNLVRKVHFSNKLFKTAEL